MALVSITRALMHLRLISSPDEDVAYIDELEEVQAKLEDASAIVLKHIKDPENEAELDADTTPGDIQAAVLIVLSDLWEHRAGSKDEDVVLSATVLNLLRGHRDPTLA